MARQPRTRPAARTALGPDSVLPDDLNDANECARELLTAIRRVYMLAPKCGLVLRILAGEASNSGDTPGWVDGPDFLETADQLQHPRILAFKAYAKVGARMEGVSQGVVTCGDVKGPTAHDVVLKLGQQVMQHVQRAISAAQPSQTHPNSIDRVRLADWWIENVPPVNAREWDALPSLLRAEAWRVVHDEFSGNVVDDLTIETAISRPSKEAIQAWRLRDLQGITTQKALGAEMTRQLGRNIEQGQVSRWLKKVEKYLAAGNILPDLPAMSEKPQTVDPAVIDLGERRDGRTPRQRPRRDPDDE